MSGIRIAGVLFLFALVVALHYWPESGAWLIGAASVVGYCEGFYEGERS